MTRAATTEECKDLEAATAAARRGRLAVLCDNGRRRFVLMTERRYQRMQARLREAAEDAADIAAAREAEKEPGSIPWEQVKRDLGLE